MKNWRHSYFIIIFGRFFFHDLTSYSRTTQCVVPKLKKGIASSKKFQVKCTSKKHFMTSFQGNQIFSIVLYMVSAGRLLHNSVNTPSKYMALAGLESPPKLHFLRVIEASLPGGLVLQYIYDFIWVLQAFCLDREILKPDCVLLVLFGVYLVSLVLQCMEIRPN